MAIIRNKNREKYTTIDNSILKNKNLSLKARGLLVTLLGLPDNWEFTEAGLFQLFNGDGKTSVRTALKELEDMQYLKRKQLRDEKGQYINTEWIVSEKPILENPISENQISEKQTQLNTNISNTKEYNICPSDDGRDNNSTLTKPKEKVTERHFEEVWAVYPRKDGKNTAYKHYCKWLEGRTFAGKKVKLTERQMWYAANTYRKECEAAATDKQYIKMGSTFFNESVVEYVQKNEIKGVYIENEI